VSTPHIRGVTGLLDQILSTTECELADSGENDSSTARTHGRTGSNDCRRVPRVVARRGRPSGKAVATASKEKVTVRIATDVIAAYRDWSWEARSQLSHLVEQALTDYEARHRSPTTGSFSQDANQHFQKPAAD
jgi:uncharacterized protein (DUF4415 family)